MGLLLQTGCWLYHTSHMTTWQRTGNLISVLNHLKILVRSSIIKCQWLYLIIYISISMTIFAYRSFLVWIVTKERISSCHSKAKILCIFAFGWWLIWVRFNHCFNEHAPLQTNEIICHSCLLENLWLLGWCIHSPILQLPEIAGISCQLFHV